MLVYLAYIAHGEGGDVRYGSDTVSIDENESVDQQIRENLANVAAQLHDITGNYHTVFPIEIFAPHSDAPAEMFGVSYVVSTTDQSGATTPFLYGYTTVTGSFRTGMDIEKLCWFICDDLPIKGKEFVQVTIINMFPLSVSL